MAVRPNPDYKKFKAPDGYKDIGWQLTLENSPQEFKDHYAQKHQSREFDNSMYMNRCTDVIRICDTCKMYWHTDMSD